MPVLPPVPKTVRVDFHMALTGQSNVQCRVFFSYAGALSQTDANTWTTTIRSAWGSNIMNHLSNACSLVSTVLTDLTSTSAAQSVDGTSVVGGAALAAVPNGVALVIKHKIARRYRGGHPKLYLPGMTAANLLTSNQWGSAAITQELSDFNAFITAALTAPAGVGAVTHVSVPYFKGFTAVTNPITHRVRNVPNLAPGTPVPDVVISNSVNPIPASQRRRNRQSS
jgi:hypothetical protein